MEMAAGDPRRLNLEDIIQASRDETGLTDMGEPDIIPGLRVLLEAFVNEANFRPTGVEAQRASLIRIVSNRMRVEDMFKRHPEILDEKIRGPIVITGLPRSGTTKLLRMMASSSDLQKLLLWKIYHPAPIGPKGPDGKDPRIVIAEQMSAMMREHFPEFYAGHPMNAFEPDEEEWMLDMVMLGYVNCHSSRTPSFEAWMDTQNFDAWYPYLRKILQLLQWQDGSPQKAWLIKAPSHLRHMALLFKSFPDATIVHCHRDPITTTISLTALNESCRRLYSDYENPEETGRFTFNHWAKQMEGYMQQRPLLEQQHRFVDVSYAELTGDATTAVERIYAAAGLELTAAARAEMRDWEINNPPGKHGKHRYSIERYGLSADEVNAGFSGYLKRFGSYIS